MYLRQQKTILFCYNKQKLASRLLGKISKNVALNFLLPKGKFFKAKRLNCSQVQNHCKPPFLALLYKAVGCSKNVLKYLAGRNRRKDSARHRRQTSRIERLQNLLHANTDAWCHSPLARVDPGTFESRQEVGKFRKRRSEEHGQD